MSRKFYLHTHVEGETGSAIAFLHGFLGSGRDWLPVTRILAREHRCLLIDLPGHGGSAWPPFTPDDPWAAVVEAFVEALDRSGMDQIHLVGYSLGGRLAMQVLQNRHDRLRSLCLESANPGLGTEAEKRDRHRQDLELAERLRTSDLGDFLDDWYKLPLFATLKRQPERLAALRQQRLQNSPKQLADALEAFSIARQADHRTTLAASPVPLTYLAGGLDSKYAAIARELAVRCPGLNVDIVPDCGHNTHLEQPETFAHLLRARINQADPP